MTRTSTRGVRDPTGKHFIYPDDSMMADLVLLFYGFSDVYQIVGGPKPLAALISGDATLLSDMQRILEGDDPASPDASFWHFPQGEIPLADALSVELHEVLRTLRNAFAHSHWYYKNLSAIDYWQALGWDTSNAPDEFNLAGRDPNNYMLYAADAKLPWNAKNFWKQSDLRILVTPSAGLRYHLHLMLNWILHGSRANVFG